MDIRFLRLCVFIILTNLFYSPAIFASDNENLQFWPGFNIFGALKNHPQFLYTVFGEARVATDPVKTASLELSPGIGYAYSPTLSFWAGFSAVDVDDSQIVGMDQKDRAWQQFVWQDYHSKHITLLSRTRLEESVAAEETAVRFRKKFILTLTQEPHLPFTPELAEEIFINLNNPAWLQNDNVVDQNRAFVGVLVGLNRRFSVEMGYLNQYQVADTGNTMNHVLLVNLNMYLS